jgi:hypothetical protein
MKTLSTVLPPKPISFFSRYRLLAAAVLVLAGTACDRTDVKDNEHKGHDHDAARKTTTHYGPSRPLGGGVARAYVTTDKEGKPTEVGVVLSEKALTNLPGADHHDHGGHDHNNSTALEFPKQAELTLFRSMTLDWNPNGHEPHPIYSKPHFDFHFYMVTEAERMTIPGLPPTEMDPELPAPQYLPTDYVPTPGRVPAMGVHWVDKTSPELNGGPFTQTFIFGSHARKVNFYEPMITLDYLLSKPEATFPVKQSAAVGQEGYYPTNYRIAYDAKAKEYRVALLDFTRRNAQ